MDNSNSNSIMNHIHKIKDMYIKFAIYNAKDFIITKIQNKNTNMTHQERIENESITISDEEIIENENNLEALEDYVIPITPSMILTVANLLTDHIELLKEESTNKMLDTKIINELERLTNQINDSYGGRNIIKPKQSLSVSSSKPPNKPKNGKLIGIIIGSLVGVSLLIFIIYKIKSKKIYKFYPSNLNKNKIINYKKQQQTKS